MRQNYSTETLQTILNNYSDLGTIKDFKFFTSGFENSNYGIETNKGGFVIKIFEGMGMARQNILFELEVMDHSYKSGIKTPHIIITKNNELHTMLGEKFVILMDLVPGQNLDHSTIDNELVYEIGQETGKMDSALKIFNDRSKTRQNYEWDLKNFLQLEQFIPLLPKRIYREIITEIFSDFKRIKPQLDTVPQGLIHNDVGLHNIIAKDGKLSGILDFSDMAFSPYIQNIATSFAQLIFCYNWRPQQAKIFLDAYLKYNKLSENEIALLYDLTRARYATIIVEFNHWNQVYGIDEQRTEAVDDFYLFLKKFTALGREGFTELLK